MTSDPHNLGRFALLLAPLLYWLLVLIGRRFYRG
jgi:hypothetical protein